MPRSFTINNTLRPGAGFAVPPVRAHTKENPLAPAMVSQEERRRTGRASTGACSGGSLTT